MLLNNIYYIQRENTTFKYCQEFWSFRIVFFFFMYIIYIYIIRRVTKLFIMCLLIKGGIEGEEHLLATLEMEANKHDEELLAEALLLQEELGVDLGDHVCGLFSLFCYFFIFIIIFTEF